jgi:hypothetical protein
MSLQLYERFNRIFTRNANYTWSHTFDDSTFTTFVSTPQDLDDRKLEYANSNRDVRQRFITNFSIEALKDSFLRNFISAISSLCRLPRLALPVVAFHSGQHPARKISRNHFIL